MVTLNTFENVHLKCTPGYLPFQISKYVSDTFEVRWDI